MSETMAVENLDIYHGIQKKNILLYFIIIIIHQHLIYILYKEKRKKLIFDILKKGFVHNVHNAIHLPFAKGFVQGIHRFISVIPQK